MIRETIEKIENRLQGARTLDADRRQELQDLVSRLKTEVEDLSRTRSEHAESIAGFADLSSREAMREEQDPQLLQLAVKGLRESAREFETTHPRLTETVNTICSTLSNLGI